MLKTKNHRPGTANGVALFVAVLTASIALAIGAGVMNIVLKQIKLASLGKESMVALFAADTGFECALLWDDVPNGGLNSIFATSTDLTPPANGAQNQGKQCASEDITSSVDWGISGLTSVSAVTTFTISDPCATVTVTKDGSDTFVRSRGYNTCDTGSPKRVERGIEIQY